MTILSNKVNLVIEVEQILLLSENGGSPVQQKRKGHADC